MATEILRRIAEILDSSAISRLVGPLAAQRGRAYATDGKVHWLTSDPELLILLAGVSGRTNQHHRVIIGLVPSTSPPLRLVGAMCTCGVRRNCKHVAAVLFSVLDRAQSDAGDDSRALDVIREHDAPRPA